MNWARFILAALNITILILAIGFAIYLKFTGSTKRWAVKSGNIGIAKTNVKTPPKQMMELKYALPDWDKGALGVRFETFQTPNDNDPLTVSVIKLTETAPQFPKGSQLLSVVKAGDTAVLDFNEEITKNLSPDSSEAILLSLQYTCGQFENIKAIKITINGKSAVNLAGNTLIHSEIPTLRQ